MVKPMRAAFRGVGVRVQRAHGAAKIFHATEILRESAAVAIYARRDFVAGRRPRETAKVLACYE